MKQLYIVGICLFLGPSVFAKARKARPAFGDYPIRQIYKGPPARPVLSKEQRRFRTVIREGAKHGIDLAGHYTIAAFGCGAGCTSFYVVDSISGKVYDGFGVADLPGAWVEKHGMDFMDRLEFHPDSRLLKINGCPGETNCGFYDYLMVEGSGLKLIYKELLPKEFQ